MSLTYQCSVVLAQNFNNHLLRQVGEIVSTTIRYLTDNLAAHITEWVGQRREKKNKSLENIWVERFGKG